MKSMSTIGLNDRCAGLNPVVEPAGLYRFGLPHQCNLPPQGATLTVGDKFPQFDLKATVSIESLDKAFFPISNDTHKGKSTLVFFYPKDFTFVCPTEIKALAI